MGGAISRSSVLSNLFFPYGVVYDCEWVVREEIF